MTEKINFPGATASTERGVLQPVKTTDLPLDDVLRLYLSAITGIDKTLVRKRWAERAGAQPPYETDWASVGVISVITEGMPYQRSRKPDTVSPEDDIQRISYQKLKCVATFYGRGAFSLSDVFREGIQLPQNNDQLKKFGLSILSVADEILHVPENIGGRWLDRYDVVFSVSRAVSKTYGVRTIASADIGIITDERGKL